jgi:two-component system, NarL family, invasion response regulator UvrY
MSVQGLINVCVVDDHPIVRRGLINFLAEQSDLRVVGEGACGSQALELVRVHHPEVLVLDINMPGQSGIELMPYLLARDPLLKVIVFSGFSEEHYALVLLRSGAMAYLSKQGDPEDLLSCPGGRVACPAIESRKRRGTTTSPVVRSRTSSVSKAVERGIGWTDRRESITKREER